MVPLANYLATCETAPEARVSGTAVFLTAQTERVPSTLLHNLKQNKVLHQTVLLVPVVTENISRAAGPDRIKAREALAVYRGTGGVLNSEISIDSRVDTRTHPHSLCAR